MRLQNPFRSNPFQSIAAARAKAARATAAVTDVRSLGGKAFSQRRRLATVAAGVLAAAVGYHVVFGHNGLTAYQHKRSEEHNLESQLKTLTKENESLRGHVERLQEDPDAIEHQAREELHYTRPGEVIVTLPPGPAAGPIAPIPVPAKQ